MTGAAWWPVAPRAVFVTLAVRWHCRSPLGAAVRSAGRARLDRRATTGTAPPPLAAARRRPRASRRTALPACRRPRWRPPARPDPSLGKHHGAYVYDASRGKAARRSGQRRTPYVPGLDDEAADHCVRAGRRSAPDHRFATKVVSGQRTGSVVLVGGGDPLLTGEAAGRPTGFPARATLQELAASTAKALRREGVAQVTLGYDASLFTGPAANAKWEPNYLTEGIAARTSALWVNEGRLSPAWPSGHRLAGLAAASGSPRCSKRRDQGRPGTEAGRSGRRRPSCRAGRVGAARRHRRARQPAQRQRRRRGAAAAGRRSRPATAARSPAACKGLRATLTKLGIDVTKARIYDGSGLSRTNQVPLRGAGRCVRVAASADNPELRHRA